MLTEPFSRFNSAFSVKQQVHKQMSHVIHELVNVRKNGCHETHFWVCLPQLVFRLTGNKIHELLSNNGVTTAAIIYCYCYY